MKNGANFMCFLDRIYQQFCAITADYAKFNMFNCTRRRKKLRMNHHTKLFENYSV